MGRTQNEITGAVFEAMGWEHIAGVTITKQGGYRTNVGRAVDHPPTADDMLAWLIRKHLDVLIEARGDEVNVAYSPSDSVRYADIRDVTASTLHAALEAAVLAVSAAQDVEQQGDDGEDDQNGGQHG